MIVADTHVIIWDALRPALLTAKAKKAIERADREDGIVFCDISLWEIAMLMKKEKIRIGVCYSEFIPLVLRSRKYVLRGIDPQIADLAVSFPQEINRDPVDRIIAATSIIEKSVLVTADQNLRSAKCLRTLW